MEDCALLSKLYEWLLYIVQNLFWVITGFTFGLAIYWWRLDQLKNEFYSLKNLWTKKFKRGDEFILKAGPDVKSLDGSVTKTVTNDSVMIFGYERGIDWIFNGSKGLIRSRIIYASFKNDPHPIPKYFVISHFDIKS
jgi:hypothetical protein